MQLDQDDVDSPGKHSRDSVNDGVFEKSVDGVQDALVENPCKQK